MMIDLIKKHVDTVIVLGGILASVMWMNGKTNDIKDQIAGLDKRLTVIETVMLCKGMMPSHVATNLNENVK